MTRKFKNASEKISTKKDSKSLKARSQTLEIQKSSSHKFSINGS
jgi:hypothetical protein